MTRRLLVTGATGFIGRALVAQVVDRTSLHVVSRQPPAGLPGNHHVADLLSASETTALVESIQPTHLVHLAWYVEHGDYWTSPENERWRRASEHLFREFARLGGRRVVGAGTSAEYDWTAGVLSEITSPLQPSTEYGRSKLRLCQTLMDIATETSASAAWARLFMVYGPGEPATRFVPSMVAALLEGRTAVCTFPDARRDFIHVEDAAAALLAILDSDVAGAINVGTGTPTALREVIDHLAKRLGNRERVEEGTGQGISLVVADPSRLHDEVRWFPRHTLASGLDDSIEWWRTRIEERSRRPNVT